ncbi:hypothetical protein N7523_007091 [Penicillium sp. IBT 18751x]|nr:hypothetical protein N7523_007091 [Penicillium sp. IBT 18751x]
MSSSLPGGGESTLAASTSFRCAPAPAPAPSPAPSPSLARPMDAMFSGMLQMMEEHRREREEDRREREDYREQIRQLQEQVASFVLQGQNLQIESGLVMAPDNLDIDVYTGKEETRQQESSDGQ